MNAINKYWQVLASIIGFVFAAGMLYSSVGTIPEITEQVQDHEKRLISQETKLNYIADGMKVLLSDRGRRR